MNAETSSLRSQRASVMLSAQVFRHDHREPTLHRVTNISETGVCLAQDGELTAGSVVVLTIGQVEHVAADVKWSRGKLAGLAFREPIDVARSRLRRTGAAPPVAAGWLADLNHLHRG
ncbi:MAG: PilZ domain-containing protein [Pseudomonadota bacterium]